jgi:hypothetical protein
MTKCDRCTSRQRVACTTTGAQARVTLCNAGATFSECGQLSITAMDNWGPQGGSLQILTAAGGRCVAMLGLCLFGHSPVHVFKQQIAGVPWSSGHGRSRARTRKVYTKSQPFGWLPSQHGQRFSMGSILGQLESPMFPGWSGRAARSSTASSPATRTSDFPEDTCAKVGEAR